MTALHVASAWGKMNRIGLFLCENQFWVYFGPCCNLVMLLGSTQDPISLTTSLLGEHATTPASLSLQVHPCCCCCCCRGCGSGTSLFPPLSNAWNAISATSPVYGMPGNATWPWWLTWDRHRRWGCRTKGKDNRRGLGESRWERGALEVEWRGTWISP